jgi:hypothetical protein
MDVNNKIKSHEKYIKNLEKTCDELLLTTIRSDHIDFLKEIKNDIIEINNYSEFSIIKLNEIKNKINKMEINVQNDHQQYILKKQLEMVNILQNKTDSNEKSKKHDDIDEIDMYKKEMCNYKMDNGDTAVYISVTDDCACCDEEKCSKFIIRNYISDEGVFVSLPIKYINHGSKLKPLCFSCEEKFIDEEIVFTTYKMVHEEGFYFLDSDIDLLNLFQGNEVNIDLVKSVSNRSC